MSKGILARKVGMTQIFTPQGTSVPVTVLEADSCRVVQRKTVGWEYGHVCIDDATRLAYVEVLPNEQAITAVAVLRRAVAHDASYGITVQRLITDNGSAYRSTIHAIACRTRDPTPPHPPLPTPNQRQSRTIHPHPPRRLGLRRHLPQQRRTQRRSRRLARLLQSPPTTRRPQPQATHRPPPRAAQPLGSYN